MEPVTNEGKNTGEAREAAKACAAGVQVSIKVSDGEEHRVIKGKVVSNPPGGALEVATAYGKCVINPAAIMAFSNDTQPPTPLAGLKAPPIKAPGKP